MSVDIPGTLTEAEKNAVEKYRSDVKTAAASEVARKEAAAAAARQAEADAVAGRSGEQEGAGVPSRTGGYGKALVQALPPGGGYPGSATSDAVGPAADLPTAAARRRSPHPPPHRRGRPSDPAGFDAYLPPADPPHGVGGGTKRRSLDAMFASGVISGLEGGGDGVPVLPRANRMSFSVPRDVRRRRAGKVAAPIVSEEMAGSNPNMKGLLVEVPYKRDVRTTSVNQRYLNTEQKFHAAFELMPHTAAFGKPRRPRLPPPAQAHQRLPPAAALHAQGGATPSAPSTAPGWRRRGGAAGRGVVESRSRCATLTILTEREEITLPVTASVRARRSPNTSRRTAGAAAAGAGAGLPPRDDRAPADLEKVCAARRRQPRVHQGWAKPVKAPETRGEAPDSPASLPPMRTERVCGGNCDG